MAMRLSERLRMARERPVTGLYRTRIRKNSPCTRIVRVGVPNSGDSDEKLAQLGTSLFSECALHWAALVRFAGR